MQEAQILQKAAVLQAVRWYFANQQFVEVDTPILQAGLVPELHVHSFRRGAQDGYLLPSPELAMKQLLCSWNRAGQARSIYQLAHCFRWEEQQDALRSWEFLMLEFYAVEYCTMKLLQFVADLLRTLAPLLAPKFSESLQWGPVILSFDQLCQRAFGLDFAPFWQTGLAGLQQLYFQATGLAAPKKLGLDDLFHLILVELLEPYIEQHIDYCVLYPYPAATPLPARHLQSDKNDTVTSWADRWELYLGGIELANACREENRPERLQEYRKRFERELCASGRTGEMARFDMEVFRLWQDLPDCSGAALGIDRLLAIAGKDS